MCQQSDATERDANLCEDGNSGLSLCSFQSDCPILASFPSTKHFVEGIMSA